MTIISTLKYTLLLILCFALKLAHAQPFDLAQERQKLQEEFGQYKNYSILIVDQDELNWRFLQAGLIDFQDDEQKVGRRKIIKNYVSEVLNLTLTPQQASNLEIYATVLRESAFAVPLVNYDNRRTGGPLYDLCAVFTASPNSNQRLEHERLLGLTTENLYGDKTYDHLNHRLSYEQMAIFSLYHELAHCLDETFMPQLYSRGEDAFFIHQGESFAETLALLMLHQRGVQNVGRTRAIHRTLYSRTLGRYFATNPHLGMGDRNFALGGVIYHLAGSIHGGLEFIQNNRFTMASMSTEELIEATNALVRERALHSRSLRAIGLYLESDSPQDVVANYRNQALDWPEMFYRPYRELIEYSDYTRFIFEKSFSTTPRPAPTSVEKPLMSLDEEGLCQGLQEANQALYNRLVNELRTNLRETDEPAELQRLRAQELNTLEQRLSNNCAESSLP